uniref:Degenerin-like protein unc-105 n=1 Tax=Steinernema glaseri TaxID=37863 RepID=A0A1I7ZVU1_9BILA
MTPRPLQERKNEEEKDTCLCFFNKKTGDLWPCYKPDRWAEHRCTSCSSIGNCVYSETGGKLPCVCVSIIRMCVRIDDPKTVEQVLEERQAVSNSLGNVTLEETNSTATDSAEKTELTLEERIPKIWEIATTPPPTLAAIEEAEEQEKALGMKDVSDPVALKQMGKENVMFAVQELDDSDKEAISYTKTEFITRCSFNGRECSIEEDFDTYLDPFYGNCFTFNSNSSGMTSERAGANYGLRFQVFVNLSDYLPTTESAGVRLTVHSPDEQPFADTHGYNAPTGFVSSFGIRMKRMSRLPKPYGDCNDRGKDDDFIYKTKNYSTEACQRSCTQKYLVMRCGCGDPRFPVFRNHKNCPVDDAKLRDCLTNETIFAARNIDQIGCRCRQPCQQDAYSVSYSASRWPSAPASVGDCHPGLSKVQCFNFYREQGAYIEVYFEQLNYESLLESEAYALPNLLSDFGGQLGLWMGVSVITIMEVGILFGELIYSVVRYPFQLCCSRRKPVVSKGKLNSSAKRKPVVSKGKLNSSAKYDVVRHANQFNHFSQFVP